MKRLKIHFVDFWPNFNKGDNYFLHLLSQEFEVVLDEKDPDLLFFSVGYDNKNERSAFVKHRCKKIFYTGEGVSANFENTEPTKVRNHAQTYNVGPCDYAFTFDFSEDCRHYRLPVWVLYIDWFKKGGYGNPSYLLPLDDINLNAYIAQPKHKFCATVFSNPERQRMEAFNKLSEYKDVHGFGKPFGNWSEGELMKYNILKEYKFSLCFENQNRPGYYTEKLFHAKTAGTIPIYFSDKRVSNDFNERSFINFADFVSMEALVAHVKEVDRRDDLYKQYTSEPLFKKNKINAEFYPSSVLRFFKETILQ
tara:strand:- start:516 stop:1439 length:924 start_codon:yes stop_codon:yes gene_type:complete